MFTKLLTIKHWQLFLPLFLLPLLIQLGVFPSLFSIGLEPDIGTPNTTNNISSSFLMTTLIMSLVSLVLLMMWFWAIATNIQKKVPAHLQLNITKFKIAFFGIIILFSINIGFIAVVFSQFNSGVINVSFLKYFSFILLSQLIIMGLMFYVFAFLAKTIKIAEIKTEVKLSDYFVYIILIWFFPIGVWLIQPKLNKIMQSYATNK